MTEYNICSRSDLICCGYQISAFFHKLSGSKMEVSDEVVDERN